MGFDVDGAGLAMAATAATVHETKPAPQITTHQS